MKNVFYASAAALALSAGAGFADGHLKFAPGDGAFTWDSF